MGAQFYAKWFLLLTGTAVVLTTFYLISSQGEKAEIKFPEVNPRFKPLMEPNISVDQPEIVVVDEKEKTETVLSEKGRPPSVHIFYYPWYGNPENDKGLYYHWNHKYLPHWKDDVTKKYPQGFHKPPKDIGSSFYPKLGPYSSRNKTVIEQHMKWISASGIDVVAISWFYPGLADPNGQSWEDIVPVILDEAQKQRVRVTFHMEPYEGRSASTLHRDIVYIIDNYGNHSALYKTKRSGKKGANEEPRPLLYFYDSYLVNTNEWTSLTKESGKWSVRGTPYDIIFVGLLVKSSDRFTLSEEGFDGMYTYFASTGFSYGSTPNNWPSLTAFCRKNGMLFVPSVGPGYDDTRVRPWNAENTKDRKDGDYYKNMFQMAHTARADIVSITSFNEWHEGTQIEPAIPFTDNSTSYIYKEYSKGPEQYLHLTLDLIKKYFTAAHDIAPAQIASIV